MKFKVISLLIILFFSSLAYSNKSPDWWCRVTSKDSFFLGFGKNQTEACADAMSKCTGSESCEIEEYGEW